MEKPKHLQSTNGVSKICTSVGNNKLKIRDNMDGVLETNGFYRKHVANEPDSIYRAVSDILFDTQFYRHYVKNIHRSFENSEEGRLFLSCKDEHCKEQNQVDKKYNTIRCMSHIFKRPIEIVYTTGPSVKILKFYPYPKQLQENELTSTEKGNIIEPTVTIDENQNIACTKPKYVMQAAISDKVNKTDSLDETHGIDEYSSNSSSSFNPVKHHKENICRKESNFDTSKSLEAYCGRSRRRHREPMLLCQSAPHQYDPVYKSDHIANAGVVQSILYEMLYKYVFNMDDALEAADFMLNAEVDPVLGKPDVYDKEFLGTAMEALDNHLIPFPYKVAKALDPETYRNIEYDVWTCEKRGNSSSRSNSASSNSRNKSRKSNSPSSAKCNQTIGNLKRGTPCVVRSPPYHDIYGYIQGLTADNKNVEVYVPLFEYCIYVARKCILPVQMLPQEFSTLRKSPTAHGKSPARPIHTRVFYSNSRGNAENSPPQNDEGYGSPTKSSESSELEIPRRDDIPISNFASNSSFQSEPYAYARENFEIPRSRHHYGPAGCKIYPGCPVCYTPVQPIVTNHVSPSVVVNLSTNINPPHLSQTRIPNQVTNINPYDTNLSNYDVRNIQDQNVLLARNRDPEWLRKVNFQVPPPVLHHPYKRLVDPNTINPSPIKHMNRSMDDNNNFNSISRKNNFHITESATERNSPDCRYGNSNSMPMQYDSVRPRQFSTISNSGDCGNFIQEPQVNSTSDVVIGYSTNLLIDIPHSPAFPIQGRTDENVPRREDSVNSSNEQSHSLENNSLPPIYVPVPYSVLGPMINSGTPGVHASYGNENKAKEKMLPILDNLHIDQRICPSTPLATPSIPVVNVNQNSENSQVQIFQFPDTVQSVLPTMHNENTSWNPHQVSQGFETFNEYPDVTKSGMNYQTPRI